MDFLSKTHSQILGFLALLTLPGLLPAQSELEPNQPTALPAGFSEVEGALQQVESDMSLNLYLLGQASRNSDSAIAGSTEPDSVLVKTYCMQWAQLTLFYQDIKKNEADQLMTAFVIECSKAGSLLANFRGEDLNQPVGGPLGFEEIKWTYYCLREEGYSEKDARALIAVVIITLSDERQ